jgi:hypothetical protein
MKVSYTYIYTHFSGFSGNYVKGYRAIMLEYKLHTHYAVFHANYGNHYGSITYVHTYSSGFHGN